MKLSKHKKSNRVYAIKMLKKAEIIKSKQIDHIHSEYNILRQISHPFIVRIMLHFLDYKENSIYEILSN